MNAAPELPPDVVEEIEAILSRYKEERFQELLRNFVSNVEGPIRNSSSLASSVHSVKTRLKDPEHLRRKLHRKYRKCVEAGQPFEVTRANFTTKINDLAGVRVLHLYTRQFDGIHQNLKALFKEYKFKLVERPFARTWDDEYRKYFTEVGVRVESSESMYTSVHYVISSASKTPLTCEIQVRTLMEEVWGEVDHRINYPEPHESLALREQLRTLARSTSAATRLVDCIFTCEGEIRAAK